MIITARREAADGGDYYCGVGMLLFTTRYLVLRVLSSLAVEEVFEKREREHQFHCVLCCC